MLPPNKPQTGQFIFCPLLPSPDQKEEVQAAADSTGISSLHCYQAKPAAKATALNKLSTKHSLYSP